LRTISKISISIFSKPLIVLYHGVVKTIGGRGNTATHVFPKNVTKIFQNFWTDFWRKFVFLTFFYFWRKFGFFDEHLEFCRKFLFLMNFVYFCSKIWFFWWKFIFMMKSWIFDKHLYFWHKFRFLSKIFILDEFCLLFCQKFVRGNTATHVFLTKMFRKYFNNFEHLGFVKEYWHCPFYCWTTTENIFDKPFSCKIANFRTIKIAIFARIMADFGLKHRGKTGYRSRYLGRFCTKFDP